jgi:hypothetical protein
MAHREFNGLFSMHGQLRPRHHDRMHDRTQISAISEGSVPEVLPAAR